MLCLFCCPRQVHDHGAVQDQLVLASEQAAVLDLQYGSLAKQRQTYKVDADVLAGMSDMQARQNVALK